MPLPSRLAPALVAVALLTACSHSSKAPGTSASGTATTAVSALQSAPASSSGAPGASSSAPVGSAAPSVGSSSAVTPGGPSGPVAHPSGSPVPVATTGTVVVAPPSSAPVYSTAGADAACQDLVTAPYEVLQCGTVGTHTVVAEQMGDVGTDAVFRLSVLHHDANGWVVDLQQTSDPNELDVLKYGAAEVDASSGLDLLVGARSSGSGAYLSVDVVTGMDATPTVALHRDLAAGSVTVDGGVMLYDAQYADGAPTADPTSYTQDQLGPGSGPRDVSATRVGEPATAPDSQLG